MSQEWASCWLSFPAAITSSEICRLVTTPVNVGGPAQPRAVPHGERYWFQTGDLCRVKVSGRLLAPPQDRVVVSFSLAPCGFSSFIVSRRFSPFPSVMWTRCGRGSNIGQLRVNGTPTSWIETHSRKPYEPIDPDIAQAGTRAEISDRLLAHTESFRHEEAAVEPELRPCRGMPGGTRTPNLLIRSQLPGELARS